MNSKKYFHKYFENLINPLSIKIVPVFNHTQALYVYTSISMGTEIWPRYMIYNNTRILLILLLPVHILWSQVAPLLAYVLFMMLILQGTPF
jgi:hypothetical protein